MVSIELEPFEEGFLIGIITSMLELRLIEPRLAIKVLQPLLIKQRNYAIKSKVKLQRKDDKVILTDEQGNTVIREREYFDDFVYGNGSYENLLASLTDKYTNTDWNKFEKGLVGLVKRFLDVDASIYGKEKAMQNFINWLKGFSFKYIKLGGIWKGIKITADDIEETRQELLKKLEDYNKRR